MKPTVRHLGVALALLGMSAATQAASLNFVDDFAPQVGSWSVSTSYNNHDGGILGQLADGSATLTLDSPGAGSALLAFDLLGFRTVDGVNCCTDVFTLSINGTAILSGSFDMGGGGTNVVYFEPDGTTITPGGGVRHIALGIDLVAGPNTLMFNYGSMQGFGDEAWGLDNVSVTAANLTAPVPEPGTWAMLAAGLGLLGLGVHRRRHTA